MRVDLRSVEKKVRMWREGCCVLVCGVCWRHDLFICEIVSFLCGVRVYVCRCVGDTCWCVGDMTVLMCHSVWHDSLECGITHFNATHLYVA